MANCSICGGKFGSLMALSMLHTVKSSYFGKNGYDCEFYREMIERYSNDLICNVCAFELFEVCCGLTEEEISEESKAFRNKMNFSTVYIKSCGDKWKKKNAFKYEALGRIVCTAVDEYVEKRTAQEQK